MNRKLIYIFAVLAAGIFLISACQQDAVGARRISPTIPDERITLPGEDETFGAGQVRICVCKNNCGCEFSGAGLCVKSEGNNACKEDCIETTRYYEYGLPIGR